MKKPNKIKERLKGEVCTYKDFLTLFPHCEKNVQDDLVNRLQEQPCPSTFCGKEVPENLNALSYGTLDDLRTAAGAEDPISACCNVLLGIEPHQLLNADVNDVFGFLSFIKRELEKINKLFTALHQTYSKEEEAAGIRELDFGSFGILDWYARRMGITNQNEVRDVAWVRIYQCMKNDNMQSEFERRLHKQYMNNSKVKKR